MKNVFFLLFFTQQLYAQEQYDFAIYHDGDVGAWEEGVVAFEKFLDWKSISHNRVTAQNINTTDLKDYYKAIYFPGGDADYYNADINSTGIKHIQDLVSNNGAYIGICAGAEFACDKLVWQGVTYDYPLNFFQGEAIGPIDELAVWPAYSMATLNMNLNDEINQFETETEDILYWGGCVFNPITSNGFDTLATYAGFLNKPAIVKLSYGTGRVLLISPHPEIEEDDERDGNQTAEELSDKGSDWNFLWTATDWLLGNPITNPNNSSTLIQTNYPGFEIYPNPAKNTLWLSYLDGIKIRSLKIYNLFGQNILELNEAKNPIDLSNINTGIYIVEVDINNIKLLNRLVIKK